MKKWAEWKTMWRYDTKGKGLQDWIRASNLIINLECLVEQCEFVELVTICPDKRQRASEQEVNGRWGIGGRESDRWNEIDELSESGVEFGTRL